MSFRDWFRRKPDPVIGSKWILATGDPFDNIVIEVLEIRCGWVKYRFLTGPTTWTRKISSLKSLYEPYAEG
jgi:hypothetical protein